MKRLFPFVLIICTMYVFTACTKSSTTPVTVHDTTTSIIKDTIIIRDTIVKKDTLVITNPKNPITGEWVGTYQIDIDQAAGTFYYGWSIFADHTFIQQGGGSNGAVFTGKGTWTLSADSTFSADVAPTDISQGVWTQHVTAKYSSVNGTLSLGKYAYTSGPTLQTGTFSLKRVNE